MVAIGRFRVPINVLQALLLLPALQEARAVVVLVEAERRALATGASVSVDHAAHLAGFGWLGRQRQVKPVTTVTTLANCHHSSYTPPG